MVCELKDNVSSLSESASELSDNVSEFEQSERSLNSQNDIWTPI